MKLVPLGDRVVIKAVRCRRNYKIRNRTYQDRQRRNHSRQRLVAVGPGGIVDGKEVTDAGYSLEIRLFILNMLEQKLSLMMKNTSL